jgi:hypothetical protein
MGRWIAVGRVPGWDDLETFRKALKETAAWRLDAKTTITSVYTLGDGRVVAECHAPSQAEFDEWLRQKGWEVESVSAVKYVARTGDIWNVSTA